METLMDEEKGLMIGLKDFCKSPFTLIEEIFSSSPVTSIKANNQKKRQNSKRLLGLIEGSSGDCQKILSGCNEAYLHFPFTDASFSKIIEIGEWNCFAHQAINESYACYGILAYHLLFSSEKEREYVNYFKRDSDAYYEGQQNGAILKSLLPFFKVNMEELRLIVIPALLQLIDPFSIESNNPQLLKQKERKTIDSIVSVMRETGLNYLQKKDEQSESYYYILDPPLESLVLAKDEAKLKDKYSIKQFISQLIDKQSILTGVFPKNSLVRKNENRVASEMKGVFGNTVHSASADRAQKKFDRKTKISFRFNEGYSNAVKKVVRIKDFM